MACVHSAAAITATISAAATASVTRAVVSVGTIRLVGVATSLSSCRSLVASRVPVIANSPIVAAHPARRFLMGAKASAATFVGKTFHDFEVEDIKGNKVSLADYKGKVALVVNVASQCGLTESNYKELTALYEKYKDQGFVVLAFPSNQFGAQEPGSNAQIENFACSRYKATFPLFSKVDVNGPNTAPVYQFLKSQKGGGILGDDIKWNFGKFLVDKEGKVVQRYAPTTGPSSIEGDIKKLL